MKGACHGSASAGLAKTNSDAPPHISWLSGHRCWCKIDEDHIFQIPFLAVIFPSPQGGKHDAKNFCRHRPLAHRRAVFPCCYFWSLHVDPAISMATSVSADVFMRYEHVLLPVPPPQPSIKELVHFESVAPSFHMRFYEQEAAQSICLCCSESKAFLFFDRRDRYLI